MQLDPFIRDYRGFMEELIKAIEAEDTLFYFDTSLLMWLLRLAPSARKEFINWCEGRPANSVRIPVWVAHELHWYLAGQETLDSVNKTLRDLQRKCDEFTQLAYERAEDGVCSKKGFTGRASYVSQVEQAVEALGKYKDVISIDQDQVNQAADEVIALVNGRVLSSDLRPVIRELSHTGTFRFSHRIPPGFRDQKKEDNRYGDAILWEEIIEDFRAIGPDSGNEPRHAILLSRDMKPDWVSSAKVVTTLGGWPKRPNERQEGVALAHPFLAHEFILRAGGKKFYVTPPSILATALNFAARQGGAPYSIDHWFQATRTSRVGSGKRAATPSPPAPPALGPTPSSPNVSELQEPLAARPIQPDSPEITFETEDAVSVMSPPIAEELREYYDSVPLEQAIVNRWEDQFRRGDWTAFKLGRVLAGLSADSRTGWAARLPAFVESLAATIDLGSLNSIVLAMATSAYFDRHGRLLRRPLLDIGQSILLWELDLRFRAALSRLNSFLIKAGANLPYLPGAERKKVPFTLNLTRGSASSAVQDIRIGGHSALTDALEMDHPRRLSTLLAKPEACKGIELRMLIAREYLIPADLLASRHDRTELTWPSDAGLVSLDTGSEGGLSALAERENQND
jgi:hypothetical protein